jgi:transposase
MFHVVELGLQATVETRRRVQQQQLGHRGRKDDPRYGIRNGLRAGMEKLNERRLTRLDSRLEAGDPNYEVTIAWRCYQELRSAFATKDLRASRKIAIRVLESFRTCPIPEIARLGGTLRARREQFLAYFTTGRATTAERGHQRTIELHRRIASDFRNQ